LSPAAEAEVTLSAYHTRLRVAESHDLLEVNVDTESDAVSRFSLERLRNRVVRIFSKVARVRRKSDRDPAP
jgi:hypothetical protein